MKIAFNLDGKLYKGTAEPLERRCDGYEIDLLSPAGKKIRFRICLGEKGNWETDDVASPDIVRAVGMELDRFDDGFEEEDLPPNDYYSSSILGDVKDVYQDGEIINEPEDVDERAIHDPDAHVL